MAHFRATIRGGNRGGARRLGSKTTGIQATINGWQNGVYVASVITASGRDSFEIYMTHGSAGIGQDYLGRVVLSDDGPRFDPAAITAPILAESEAR